MLLRIYLRPNLLNPFMLIIWTTLRQIDISILSDYFDLKQKYILISLLFFGEFVAGLILFLYHLNFLKKKSTKTPKKRNKLTLTLIERKNYIRRPDHIIKIYLLIFITSFLDFVEIIICYVYLPKFNNLSNSLFIRFYCILTIISSLFFRFLLKYKIYKHQFFSLIIIGICLALIIITEISFQKINELLTYSELILAIIYLIFVHLFLSLLDCIEKYLYDYDFVNEFQVLMFQGLFGLIIALFYYIKENPLIEIKKIFNTISVGKFILFLFLLLMYSVFTGLKNIYRVTTNKIFNPVTKSLADYLMNPFFIIYYFLFEKDFYGNDGSNIYFFLINLFLAIIIDFCGLVYNEFIILFFWGLEYDTHKEVSIRALSKDDLLEELDDLTSFDIPMD